MTREWNEGGEGDEVELAESVGQVHADLSIGANIVNTHPLQANANLSNRGVQLFGAGFIVTPEEASTLGLGFIPGLERHIRDYRTSKLSSHIPMVARTRKT